MSIVDVLQALHKTHANGTGGVYHVRRMFSQAYSQDVQEAHRRERVPWHNREKQQADCTRRDMGKDAFGIV